MTPAELDTRRRYLGLSMDELAALCRGVRTRQARRWVVGDAPVPQDVVDTLEALEDAMEQAAQETLRLAREQQGAGLVMLWRYRTAEALARSPHASSLPFGAHAMLIAWTADLLESEGHEVEIAWAE